MKQADRISGCLFLSARGIGDSDAGMFIGRGFIGRGFIGSGFIGREI